MDETERAPRPARGPCGAKPSGVPREVLAAARGLAAATTADRPAAAERHHATLRQLYGFEALTLRSRQPSSEFESFLKSALAAGRSFGQLFQDLFALWASGERRGGFFVEVGVGDGVHLSNTLLLEEDFGWHGILVEPHPEQAERIRARRTAILDTRCVTDRTGDVVAFDCASAPELSRSAVAARDAHDARGSRRVVRTVAVPTVSLADLLAEHDAPADMDFLSLDIEGGELLVLDRFPFGRWRFAAAVIEHNHGEQRGEIHALMTRHGYRRVFEAFSRFDDWYLHDALAPAR